MWHMVNRVVLLMRMGRVFHMDEIWPMTMGLIVGPLDSHDAWVKRLLKTMSPMDASMRMPVAVLALRRTLLLDLIDLVCVFVDVALALRLYHNVFRSSHRTPPKCTCMADRQLVSMDYLVIAQTWLPLLVRTFVVHTVCIQLDMGCPIAFVDCAVNIGTRCSTGPCKLVQLFRRPMVFSCVGS